MDLGIMFFSSASPRTGNPYELLVAAAKIADARGFRAVWTPERHFHRFGGSFPNPAVVSSALAMITRQIQIRAGSLISPLHDTIRIAEEWAVVDNLSGGRVGVSFGSGWNSEDFVFFPDNHARRQELLYEQVEEVRALWRGERIRRRVAGGREIEVEVFPKAVQKELPVWVTSSGNPKTFVRAGEIGANLLTHLIGQTVDELADKVDRYRSARKENGFDPATGTVSLMLHTYLGRDLVHVREKVRDPFREYLRSAVSLEQMAAQGGGYISGGHHIEYHDIPPEDMEDLLDLTFERYFETASLLGTPASCRGRLRRFAEAGIDEIACLIDFLDDTEAVLQGLGLLAEFREEMVRQDANVVQATLEGFSGEIELERAAIGC